MEYLFWKCSRVCPKTGKRRESFFDNAVYENTKIRDTYGHGPPDMPLEYLGNELKTYYLLLFFLIEIFFVKKTKMYSLPKMKRLFKCSKRARNKTATYINRLNKYILSIWYFVPFYFCPFTCIENLHVNKLEQFCRRFNMWKQFQLSY